MLARQSRNGSWRYPGGKRSIRSQENYDPLETFRHLGILVEKFGFTRQHSSTERAATFLLSFQTDEGDLRGIYGNKYATTYVGAIVEVLIKAGYVDDPRIANALAWLLAMRQMVLRAFAAHPAWLDTIEVRKAAELLASRLYKRYTYTDRGDVSYWERVSFPLLVHRHRLEPRHALTARFQSRDTHGRRGTGPAAGTPAR